MTKIGVALFLAGAFAAITASAVAQESVPETAFNPNPHASLDLGSLEATRSQPLFTPSRAPPVVFEEVIEPEIVEAEPVIEAEPELEPPQLQLVGVVMTQAQQVAILVDESTGEVHRVRAGEDYEGWTMSIIDPRSVAFAMGEDSHSMTLFTEFGRGSMSAHAPEYDDEFSEYDEFSDPASQFGMEGGEEAESGEENGGEPDFGDMYGGDPHPTEGN